MNRRLVVDCSVSSCWFIPDEHTLAAERILNAVLAEEARLLVPEIWWYETANVLRSCVRRKRLDETRCHQVLRLAKSVPKETVSVSDEGAFGIFQMAIDADLSAYDAAYLRLALTTSAELFTADTDLLKLKPRFGCIRAIEEF